MEGRNNAVSILQYNSTKGFHVEGYDANRFRDRWGLIHARYMHPALYDPKLMKPSKLGIDYLLPIFTDAIGEDDAEHMRQTLFDPGNLAQPYHSINTDVHKRIRYLEGNEGRLSSDPHLIPYINVKLALLGFPPVAQYREKERLLANHLCPADQRIQTFLYDYLQDVPVAKLPLRTFTLDRPGMARAAFAAGGPRRIHVRNHQFLSRQAGRAAQSAQRPPHDAGNFPRRRRRPADSRRQDRRAEGHVSEKCSASPSIRRAT